MKITDEMLYKAAPKAEDYIMEKMEQADIEKHKYTPEFKKKVRRIIYTSEWIHWMRKHRKIATAAIICIVIGISAVLPVSAKLYEQIMYFMSLKLESSVEQDVSGEIIFHFLPAGAKYKSDTYGEGEVHIQSYTDSDGLSFQVIQRKNTDDSRYNLSSEEAIDIIYRDGIHYYVLYEEERYSIFWEQQGYALCLIGNYDKDNLLKIAYGIEIR